MTAAGRFLLIVTTWRDLDIRVVTAFDAPKDSIEEYQTKVKTMESRQIPKFATEAEEANWWYEHRNEVSRDVVVASQTGRLAESSKARFEKRTSEHEREESERQHAAAVNPGK